MPTNNEPYATKVVKSEEEDANIINRYLYIWVGDLFARGWERFNNKEILLTDDLLTLPDEEDPDRALALFEAEWKLEQEKAHEATEKNRSTGKPEVIPSIFSALRRSQKVDVIVGAIFRLLADGCTVAQPFILKGLIEWLGKYVYGSHCEDQRAAVELKNSTVVLEDICKTGITSVPGYEGFIWAIGIGLTGWFFSFFNNASLFHTMKAFSNMRSAVTLMLFNKALTLEGNHGVAGDAMQLHNTDTFKFVEAGFFFQYLWSSPLIIIGSLIALHYFIGWAGVMSIGVMIIFIPIQGISAGKMMAARAACTSLADKRLNAVNEFLQGIRIVKFMGWEDDFEKRVAGARMDEVSVFNKMYFYRSIVVIMVSTMPLLVSFCVFAIAYSMGEDIDAASIFPALAMLNVLRLPMTFLPLSISKFVDLSVSLGRVHKFIDHREKDQYLKRFESEDVSVRLQNADLQCIVGEGEDAKHETLLANVNVEIPKNKLTIVVGPTGSGKSTLIHGAVGEGIVSETSYVGVSEDIAYVTQEAWIMNATLRDNILMGKEFDKEKYLDVINNCALVADLRQLTASDETEIGERGINLSGGQKQRVAFARAAYSGNGLVLMDDPLSAVDAHVCVALFEDCIQGLLKDRTRVLVTHQVQFLPQADNIIVINDREITFQGTFEELQNSDIDVTDMMDAASPGSMTPGGNHRKGDDADLIAATPAGGEANDLSPKNDSFRQKVDEIPEPQKKDTSKLMSEELQVQGAISAGTFKWFYGIQGVVPITLTAITFIIWRAFNIIADLMISWWSTRTKVAGKTLSEDQYLLWYFIFIALTVVWVVIRQIPFVWGILNAAKQSHHQLVHSVLHAPTSFFDTTPMGRIMSRFSKDMEAMDLVIPESLNFFYNLVLVIIGAFVIMCYGAPYLSVLLVVMGGVFYLVFRYYIATNRAQKRLEANNRSPMAAVMSETLGGLPTIRAYKMNDKYIAKHTQKVSTAQRSTYGWRNSQRWLSLRVDSLSAFIALATALLVVGLIQTYDFDTQVDILPVMALGVSYAMAMGGAIGYITQMSAELESAFSSVERIKEYSDDIEQEREVVYGTNEGEFPAPDPSWPKDGHLVFDDVCCRYRDGLPLVLKNVSFEVKDGEKVGIVGRTGSGKSTIMLTLFRMLELASGEIRLSGQAIANLTMKDLRSKITIIPQDPLLFSGTIRSNLDPFETSTDEIIWGVLDRVGMSDRVKKDEMGLDAVVAERGGNFSVGQRQLLCLARALLKKCKILLLDEATASVDFESDAMIQRTIRSEFSDCTVLTIAHRLATIIDSDKVCVLDHGVLKEFDHPADLLDDSSSQFYSMVSQLGEEQFAQLAEEAARAKKNASPSSTAM